MAAASIEDRFAYDTLIGRGSYGEVFRGVDRASGQHVAIKRLHAHHADADTLERLRVEAEVVRRLAHPNVVGFVDYGVDNEGRHCLVLEWLDGVDLATRRRASPVLIDESLAWVRQAALGLDALHAAGIVHRDVKPANFIVLNEARGAVSLKLIDFGIARVLAADRMTTTGTVLGTPAYMSPEQARGREDLSPRSDLFSLGVVLYELLAGRRPFTARDVRALLGQILLQAPPPIRSVAPHVPLELESILEALLAKEADERFASGRALAAALGDVLASLRPAPPSTALDTDDAPPTTSEPAVATLDPVEARLVTIVLLELPPHGDAPSLLASCRAVAEREGGTLEPMLGRRALVLFGTVKSQGDEAIRAARASLQMRRLVAGARVAMATCRTLARSGTISGDAIERLAARFDRASEHGVVLDEASARLLGDAFDIADRGGEHVLLPASAFGRPPRLAGRQTATVGRDDELEWLTARFDEARAERKAVCVLLEGPAGIGKSRLRAEFVERVTVRSPPPRVLLGRGDVLRTASPFAMLGDLLLDAAGIVPGDSLDLCRERLRTCVAQSLPAPDVDRVTVFFGECVGIPFPDDERPILRAAREDGMFMGDQIRRAFQDWLVAEATHHAVVLAIDDLQWSDHSSLHALGVALEAVRTSPVLLVAFARPGFVDAHAGLWSEHGLQAGTVRELAPAACEKLVRSALGERATDTRVRAIVERAGGHAFFLEELVRGAAEGDDAELPLTVQAIVQSRLDSLEPDERALVRVASVHGSRFRPAGAAAVLGVDAADPSLRATIERLCEREVLVRSTRTQDGDAVHAFAQPLVRDTAYASIPDGERREMHHRVAEWLETTGSAQPAALAEHYERSDVPQRALRLYWSASMQALRGNDFVGSAEYAHRGLALSPEPTLAGELDLLRAESLRWIGEVVAAEASAARAVATLPPNRPSWYRAMLQLGRLNGTRGRVDELKRLAAMLLASRPQPEAVRAAGFAFYSMAFQISTLGAWAESFALLDAMRQILAPNAADEPALEALLAMGEAHRARHAGDMASVAVHFERAVPALEAAGELREANNLAARLGYTYLALGAFARGREVLERVIPSVERMGMKRTAITCAHNLGYALGRLGEVERGIEVERQAVEYGARFDDPRIEGSARAYLSQLERLAGRHDAAEREARTGLALRNNAPDVTAELQGALANALLSQGRVDEALVAAREAMREADKHGAFENEIIVRCVLASVLDARGEHDAARAAWRTARASLEAKVARFRDPALRETFLTNIAEHAAAWARGA